MRVVTQYHYTAWPDHGVPKFATPLLSFIRRINREYPKNRGSMVVHCRYRARGEFMVKALLFHANRVSSAGVGRTGTFIVIDTMMERIEDGEPIDIYSCVASLRTKRQDMVQTEVCAHALRKFGTCQLMSRVSVGSCGGCNYNAGSCTYY